MRLQFFFIDLLIFGWLGLLLVLALTGIAFGDAAPALKMLPVVGGLLLAYVVLQRFVLKAHRERGSTQSRWLQVLALVGLIAPIPVMPATFLEIGHAMQANNLVPSIESHPSFDPSVDYDPDHADGKGLNLGPHGGATAWDLRLKEADIAILGFYPPEAIKAWHRPWLSGVMQYCYLFYYLAPMLAGLPLLFQKRLRDFRVAAGVIAGCLISTYLLYFFFPSTGPRFEGGIEYWLPQESGWFGAEAIYRVIDSAETFRWDAFPSGHVAVSLASLLVALKTNRRVGYFMILPVLGLCMATIYMGYHYGTDVLGGIACTLASWWLVPRASKWWEQKLWARELGKAPEGV